MELKTSSPPEHPWLNLGHGVLASRPGNCRPECPSSKNNIFVKDEPFFCEIDTPKSGEIIFCLNSKNALVFKNTLLEMK